MNFIEALGFYFETVLCGSAINFIIYFLIALSFAICTFPKEFDKNDKKPIYRAIIYFLCTYAACIVVAALSFGISKAVNADIIFNICIPVLVCILSAVFSKRRPIHKYLKTALLVTTAFVVETLSKTSGYLIGLINQSNQSIEVYIARIVPYLVFPGIAIFLRRVDIAKYRNISSEEIVIITILSITLIAASVFEHIYYFKDYMTNIILMALNISFLFILAFSYYATYKNIENRHKITNLEVQKTLEDAGRMSIAIDQNNREELAKIRHDMKNQISYLTILIQQGKNEEALKYINDLADASSDVLNSFSCSNNVINSIINLELTKAKILNIKTDIKVVVPPMLPFKDNDLVSLLTNMIDNALENYKSENNEAITIRILKQNDFIRFLVSNPTDVKKLKRGNLTSTTKTGRGHGYGTKIIRNIAKTYNGYVEFNVEDNKFVCDAVLDINQKE